MYFENNFLDLCSGIGGGRLGFELNNLKCIGHSEIDTNALNTYKCFFGDSINFGDLNTINISKLPNFNYLIAGFPCQTFSIVGKREGLENDKGKIIYKIFEILKLKRPSYFLLENVKGLVSHKNGETLKTILALLNEDYQVEFRILNSYDYDLPQARERIYFIGIRKDKYKLSFEWPIPSPPPKLISFLDSTNSNYLNLNDKTFNRYLNNKYNKDKFFINDILKEDYLILDTRQSDLRLYENKIPTLRHARQGILYVRDSKLVKLSGYEALMLQGFKKELISKTKDANNKLLSLAGNAMSVTVIQKLARALKSYNEK